MIGVTPTETADGFTVDSFDAGPPLLTLGLTHAETVKPTFVRPCLLLRWGGGETQAGLPPPMIGVTPTETADGFAAG